MWAINLIISTKNQYFSLKQKTQRSFQLNLSDEYRKKDFNFGIYILQSILGQFLVSIKVIHLYPGIDLFICGCILMVDKGKVHIIIFFEYNLKEFDTILARKFENYLKTI